MNIQNKVIGSLIGLAVGDALGCTGEFKVRDSYPLITDMVGGGAFNLKPGEWTDDTSMAYALGDSIRTTGFDPHAQLKCYADWYQNGAYSSTGQCFDIGVSTATAIRNWIKERKIVNNDDFLSCGNGSIMRLAPVAIHYCTSESFSPQYIEFLNKLRESSITTHAYQTPVDACVGLGVIMNRMFYLDDKQTCLDFHCYPTDMYGIMDEDIAKVLEGSYLTKKRSEIKSTGYCVDTLEAALWCFQMTRSFKEAVLLAANLGDDADTVAAVTGQIAGAFYGYSAIPSEWLVVLAQEQDLVQLAKDLYKKSPYSYDERI